MLDDCDHDPRDGLKEHGGNTRRDSQVVPRSRRRVEGKCRKLLDPAIGVIQSADVALDQSQTKGGDRLTIALL